MEVKGNLTEDALAALESQRAARTWSLHISPSCSAFAETQNEDVESLDMGREDDMLS